MFRAVFSVALALLPAAGAAKGHHYAAHAPVPVVVNTVGPFNNPTETYPYYSLPFCQRSGKQKRHKQSLGETLGGARKVQSPYDVTFLDPVPWRTLCEEDMDVEDLLELKDAVEDDFFFEMFLDDLPMWGYVGEVIHEDFLIGKSMQGAGVFLFPHLHFSIGYHNDQIVSANVSTDPTSRVDISDPNTPREITFSYSVEWVHQPHIKYSNRMKLYEDSQFLPSTFEIHWLSIINSIVLVMLLTGFLSIILMRILKKDFSRYVEVDEEEITEEETGWKMIHGDVFRQPPVMTLLVALVGAGAQLFFTVLILLSCVLLGAFKATRRGALLTAFIAIYAMCGLFGGMVAARLFKQLKGSNWVWNLVLTSLVFPVPLTIVFSWVNSVAWAHMSTTALPVTTIMVRPVYLITLLCESNCDLTSLVDHFYIRLRSLSADRRGRGDWPQPDLGVPGSLQVSRIDLIYLSKFSD